MMHFRLKGESLYLDRTSGCVCRSPTNRLTLILSCQLGCPFPPTCLPRTPQCIAFHQAMWTLRILPSHLLQNPQRSVARQVGSAHPSHASSHPSKILSRCDHWATSSCLRHATTHCELIPRMTIHHGARVLHHSPPMPHSHKDPCNAHLLVSIPPHGRPTS